MIEDTETEVRRLLDYCGLPFEEQCLRFYETDAPVRTASSEQVRRPIFKEGMEQWRHFEPWLGPLKQALGPVLDAYPGVPDFSPIDQALSQLNVPSSKTKGSKGIMSRSRSTQRPHRLNIAPAPSRGSCTSGFALRRLAARLRHFGDARRRRAAWRTPRRPPIPAPTDTLEEVTVTAQKVTENLQNVPISIETLETQKLEQLNITNLDDYVQYLAGRHDGQGHRARAATASAPRTCTCAASSAARTATIPRRSRASARISMSSP